MISGSGLRVNNNVDIFNEDEIPSHFKGLWNCLFILLKPFSCSECGERFRQKSYLDKHILSHKMHIDSSPDKGLIEAKQGYKSEQNIKESSIEQNTKCTPRNVLQENKIKKTKRGLRCPEQRRSSRTPKRGNSKTNGEARYKLYGKLKR